MTRAAAIAVAVLVALPCFGGGVVYEFDGVNDAIDCGEFDPTGNNGQFLTVSAWVRNDQAPDSYIASQYRTDTLERSWLIGVDSSSGKYLRVIIAESGTAFFSKDYKGTTELSATWSHVAFVWDSGTLTLYVNGVEETVVKDKDNIFSAAAARTAHVYMAARENGISATAFDGQIFLPRIHNRALPAAEIRGLYVAGGGRNTFGALSVVLPRANDESVVYTLDAPVLPANLNTGKVLAEDAVVASKDAARNYGLAKGGVTVGSATISPPAP